MKRVELFNLSIRVYCEASGLVMKNLDAHHWHGRIWIRHPLLHAREEGIERYMLQVRFRAMRRGVTCSVRSPRGQQLFEQPA